MRKNLVNFIAVLTIVVGGAVMLAWWFNIEIVKSFIPGSITMKFTTAICFVCTGILLWSVNRYVRQSSTVLEITILFASLTLLLLMGTMLISQIFSLNTGLENLFVKDIDLATQYIPGKPSLGTMVCFFIIALAGILTVLNFPKHYKKIFLVGLLLNLFGLLALLGYVLKLHFLYWNFSSTSNAMAINTAMLFTFLGVGFMLLPRTSELLVPEKLSMTKRNFIWSLVLLTVLPIFLTASFTISSLREQISTMAVEHLETVAGLQELRIQESIRKYEIMADGMSSRIQLKAELKTLNSTNNLSESNARIQAILISAMSPFNEIKEVAVFNNHNDILLISPQKAIYSEYQSVFDQDLQNHNFVIKRTNTGFTLYLVEPIQENGQLVGTLVLNFGTQLFDEITDRPIGLGYTGETLLGYTNTDGDIQFITKVREPKKNRTIKTTETDIPIVQVLVFQRNITYESANDYRGVPVVAVTKYLPRTNWGLVVKMDKAEIFAPVKQALLTIIFVATIFLIFSIVTAFIIGSKFKVDNQTNSVR